MADSSKPKKTGSSDIPQPQSFQGQQPNSVPSTSTNKFGTKSTKSALDPSVWKTPGQQMLEKGLQQAFGHDPKGSKPSTKAPVIPKGRK